MGCQAIVAPEPTKRLGKNGASVIAVVSAGTVYEFDVVFAERERCKHLLIPQGPVPMLIVQVAATVLEEDAERFLVAPFSNESGIVVSTANIDEASDVAENFPERIGTFPGDRKGANAAADGAPIWVLSDSVP